jgi:hypothetical protein
MLSKFLPWDFLQRHPSVISTDGLGSYAYLCSDPYVEKIIMDQLPKKDLDFSIYTGSSFTLDFVEEHFVNLSFFSTQENLIIMNAESISADVLNYYLSNIAIDDRVVLFFFTKSNKIFTEMGKNEKVKCFEIESPRPWDGPMIWNTVCKVKKIKNDSALSNFALENLEHNFESFFWLADSVLTHFPKGGVDLQLMSEIIKRERWDYFELVNLFHKNPKLLISEMLKKNIDHDWIREISNKLQLHIVKLLFPDEIAQKQKKLSKYDQEILAMSKKLIPQMLRHYLDFFGNLEIAAKSSDQLILNYLRLELLR